MTIRFKKKRLKRYMIYGILWLALAAAALILNSNYIFVYGYSLQGILLLGASLYENKNQYLTIENGIISKNHLITKKINVNEIKQIKRFGGDIILNTDSAELRINTKLIEENSLLELNTMLDHLQLKTK